MNPFTRIFDKASRSLPTLLIAPLLFTACQTSPTRPVEGPPPTGPARTAPAETAPTPSPRHEPPRKTGPGTPQAPHATPAPLDQTLLELPKLNPGETVSAHHGYRFSFDPKSHLVRWVAYSLTPDKVRAKIATRSNKFTADRKIAGSADPADYEGSGYDRGHLAPAEDMRWSKESEDDSFYMTNMTPQKPKFNRGLWKKLETRVRKWAGDFDETYIVSGPVLDGKCLEKIARDICVPERFFKVILARSGATLMSIGFLMPQNYQDTNIADYATSVAQVETVTHLDFFAKLPKSTQQKVESQNDFESWPR